jgi:hypothetical protein
MGSMDIGTRATTLDGSDRSIDARSIVTLIIFFIVSKSYNNDENNNNYITALHY